MSLCIVQELRAILLGRIWKGGLIDRNQVWPNLLLLECIRVGLNFIKDIKALVTIIISTLLISKTVPNITQA